MTEHVAPQPEAQVDAPQPVPLDPNADVFAYIQNLSTQDPEKRNASLAHLQSLRAVGETPDEFSKKIDEAIVALAVQGDADTVHQLLTPNFLKERDRLEPLIAGVADPSVRDTALHLVEDETSKKFDEFRARVADYVDVNPENFEDNFEELIYALIKWGSDPEMAFQIPAEFWKNDFGRLSRDSKKALFTARLPLDQKIAITTTLLQNGIAEQIEPLLEPMAKMNTVEQQAFVTGYKEVVARNNPGWYAAVFKRPDIALHFARQLWPHHSVQTAFHLLVLCIPHEQEPIDLNPNTRALIERAISSVNDGVESRILATGALRLEKLNGTVSPDQLIDTIEATKNCLPTEYDTKKEFYGIFASIPSIKNDLHTILERNTMHTPEGMQQLQLLLQKASATQALYDIVLTNVTALRDGEETDIPLDSMAAVLDQFFDNLEVPTDDIRAKLLGTWVSLSALHAALWLNKKQNHAELTDDEIKYGVHTKTLSFYEQATSLQTYIEKYGIEETLQLHSIFRITNFNRAKPESFHTMLQNWKGNWTRRPERDNHGVPFYRRVRFGLPAMNVKVAVSKSYNPAFMYDAEQFFDEFGNIYSYYFEVDSENMKQDVATAMIAVGNRERRFDRRPQERNMVDNVIIAGHGSPDSIEGITAQDYVKAVTGRARLNRKGGGDARPNTYSKHLGSKFRLILEACQTAKNSVAKIFNSDNIAQLMSVEHDTEVHGFTESIDGGLGATSVQIRKGVATAQAQSQPITATVYRRSADNRASGTQAT